MSFRSRLKDARKAAGLSQEELGEKVGVGKRTISGYESEGSGSRDPSVKMLADLMDALHIDANYLFQDEVAEIRNTALSLKERSIVSKYREITPESQSAIDGLLNNLYERDNPGEFRSHIEAPQKSGSVDKIK